VREHGGWIDVQSELNNGSTFTVYLPMTRPTTRTTGERPALRGVG
jgi:signal transduction histidine kinase